MAKVEKLEISIDELNKAISSAKVVEFLDNLRDRDPAVRFDSAVRGYLGEDCFKKWLISHGFSIADSNFLMRGPNMDIDIGVFNRFHRYFRFEVKTSLVPDMVKTELEKCDSKDVYTIIEELFDIKIIKRPDEDSPEKIGNDVFVQIYFSRYTKARDEYLKSLRLSKEEIRNMDNNQIIDAFGYTNLKQVFFAWLDRESLCKYVNTLNPENRFFSLKKRQFWTCPLRISRSPSELPGFLNSTR